MAVNPWFRLLFYGMLGFSYEIIFTSLWDFVASDFTNFKFVGFSSIWSFFIYGTCSFCGEQVYLHTRKRLSTLLRGLIYVQMAYTWEFIGGLILNQFSARTWDYTHYKYDVMGLIALEYAPLWFCSGLLQEYFYEYLTQSLQLSANNNVESKEGTLNLKSNNCNSKVDWHATDEAWNHSKAFDVTNGVTSSNGILYGNYQGSPTNFNSHFSLWIFPRVSSLFPQLLIPLELAIQLSPGSTFFLSLYCWSWQCLSFFFFRVRCKTWVSTLICLSAASFFVSTKINIDLSVLCRLWPFIQSYRKRVLGDKFSFQSTIFLSFPVTW